MRTTNKTPNKTENKRGNASKYLDASGHFKLNNPGGGRPKASYNNEPFLDTIRTNAPALIEVLIKKGLKGNIKAIDLLLSKIIPSLRSLELKEEAPEVFQPIAISISKLRSEMKDGK
jgi:hypothetical protein